MILTKKVRLIVDDSEEHKLYCSANAARWAYNWALTMQRMNYRFGGKFIPDTVLRKHLTKLKKRNKYIWLNDVSNNVLKQSIKDACKAYKRFFSGISNLPKYKSKRKTTPSFYNDNERLNVGNKTVWIERIGRIKTSEQIPMGCKYYNPRVKYDGKYWYLTVGIDVEKQKVNLDGRVIGIDVGIKELAVTSDGITYGNINRTKTVKNEEKRLKRLQRRASRKYKKGQPKSKNLVKLEKEIRRKHRRLKNIRTNYIHQVSTEIVKTKPSRIVMEDLNIKGMLKNKHLSKAVANQKLFEFKMLMKYKSEKYGIEIIEVGRWFPSSKKCHRCGEVNKDLKLSDRMYQCGCGNICDRDLNASYNLRDYQVS